MFPPDPAAVRRADFSRITAISMRSTGASYSKIAYELGVGHKRAREIRRLGRVILDKIGALLDEGKTYAQIAEAMGREEDVIRRYAVAAGWEEHPVITEVWEGVVPAGRT